MSEANDKLKELSGKLTTFVDTFEVKAHLAKQDAVDAWQQIEPKLKQQKEKAEALVQEFLTKKDEAGLQTYLGVNELTEKLEVITGHVEKILSSGKSEVKTGIDTAKLKLDLASMDADDYLKGKKEEIEKVFSTSRNELKKRLDSAVDKVSDKIQNFIDGK